MAFGGAVLNALSVSVPLNHVAQRNVKLLFAIFLPSFWLARERVNDLRMADASGQKDSCGGESTLRHGGGVACDSPQKTVCPAYAKHTVNIFNTAVK
jgi:hypothetical protein